LNEKFFNDIITKYGDTVLRVAISVTGNKQDAEDIFSDVFFVLWQSKEVFNSELNIKAWLIRVAINKSKNIRKSAYNRYKAELHDNIAATENMVDLDIDAAMQKLEPLDRAILYLHYFEGYSFVDIAYTLGIPDSSVRSKAKRAREEMKEFLE